MKLVNERYIALDFTYEYQIYEFVSMYKVNLGPFKPRNKGNNNNSGTKMLGFKTQESGLLQEPQHSLLTSLNHQNSTKTVLKCPKRHGS